MVCCPGETPSDRNPMLDTSTIDTEIVWSGGNSIQSNNSKPKNKPNNDGRIKGKRRAELSKKCVLIIFSCGREMPYVSSSLFFI